VEDGRVWKHVQPAPEGVAGPQVPPVNDERWQSLLYWMGRGQLVPVIGPDVNRGLLLSNAEITQLWANKYGYGTVNYPTNNRNDLPRVSRFVEILSPGTRYPHLALLDLLKTDLLAGEARVAYCRQTRRPLPHRDSDAAGRRGSRRNRRRTARSPPAEGRDHR